MVWDEQTRDFSEFCQQLKLVQAGDRRLEKAVLDHGIAATEQMEKVLKGAANLQGDMKDVSKMFNDAEIRALRTGTKYPSEIATKVMELVDELAVRAMKDHPHGVKRPKYEELPNTFLYRISLAHVVYIIRWIREGSQVGTRPEKVRNDLIDVNFATYATYFDGILTNDKKLFGLYRETHFLLNIIKRNVAKRLLHHMPRARRLHSI